MKLGQPWSREIIPGVFRLGTTYVGCYAVEEGGGYTFIDTGLPGYWAQIAGFLASRDTPLSAVNAIVLTHNHDDHRGNAERLRTEAGAKVLVHHDDLGPATRRGKPPRFPLWKPRVLHYLLHVLANGGARVPPVLQASGFGDDEILDIRAGPA